MCIRIHKELHFMKFIRHILQVINEKLLDYADQGKGAFVRSQVENRTPDHPLDLSGAKLEGANLRGVDLHKTDLSEAILAEALLVRANLSHANLKYANLRRAYLGESNLTDANLEKADLRGADLRGANLTDANLDEALLNEDVVLEHFPDITLHRNFLLEVKIKSAKYDKHTRWPDHFDPIKAGAVLVNS